MQSMRWVAICQWCGKRGGTASTTNGRIPSYNPNVPGKCPSHPSGNKDMAHGAQWVQG